MVFPDEVWVFPGDRMVYLGVGVWVDGKDVGNEVVGKVALWEARVSLMVVLVVAGMGVVFLWMVSIAGYRLVDDIYSCRSSSLKW